MFPSTHSLAIGAEHKMRQTLEDIRQKLNDGVYKNEEHVRLSLVARLLLELGWDLWNPNEVNTEFSATPTEDTSRVDVALFLPPNRPVVFIEVKSVGKLQGDIRQFEIQLRDYNRNNTATFAIITDGEQWRFYYSPTEGEFSNRCFMTLDVPRNDIEDLEKSFQLFLSKGEISNGNAKRKAEDYLQLSQKQRKMEGVLPQARKAVLEPPYLNLPQAIVKLVASDGLTVTPEEVAQFIQEFSRRKPLIETPPVRTYQANTNIPKTLAHIIEVCHEVLENNRAYPAATKIVAKKQKTSPQTIGAQCTREIELNASQFQELLQNKGKLINHLVRHFPEYKAFIRNELE